MNAEFQINGICLQTDRLLLRSFKSTDLQDFYAYAQVDGVGEMAGWKHHESIEESQQILDEFIQEDKTFAIVFKENNQVIGSLGVEKYGLEEKLTEFDGYQGRELGIVLSKDYWGQGIALEATKAVIAHLFDVLDLDFLLCGYYDFNVQSKRVQEKCGFKPYRKLVMDTCMGTKEPGVLNLLINPNKKIKFVFSHPETLIYPKEKTALHIQTQRLHLSAISDNDKEYMLNILTNKQVAKTFMLPDYASREDAIPTFEKIKELSQNPARFVYGVYQNQRLIGFFNDVNLTENSVEMGYVIHPDYHNQGYATEAFSAVIKALFESGFECVKAGAFAENTASMRVMEKCGMTKTGEIEELEYRGEKKRCICYEIKNQ
jgi:ribosomal-protein-alanine N-acetyltransferase